MTVTLELPSELEADLQQKAQVQGLSVPDILLNLVKREAERSLSSQTLYSQEEIDEFVDTDRLPPEMSEKVRRLLGR